MAPPQSVTSKPRWSRYQAPRRLGSADLKNIPPMPVTRFIVFLLQSIGARSAVCRCVKPQRVALSRLNGLLGSVIGNLYRQLDIPKKLSRLGTIVCEVRFVATCVRFHFAGNTWIERDPLVLRPLHERLIASKSVSSVDQRSVPSFRK